MQTGSLVLSPFSCDIGYSRSPTASSGAVWGVFVWEKHFGPDTLVSGMSRGVSVFELARIIGTSAHMIERSYGVLIEGAGAGIASRLDAFDAAPARAGIADRERLGH